MIGSPGPIGLAWEFAQAPFVAARLVAQYPALVRQAPHGDGHTVLVIPGFTAGDLSTVAMRRFLEDAGYRAAGWNLGVNLGIRKRDEVTLEKHIVDLAADGPITIIGWSLGGIYAHEAARRRPELVRQVITLGTPIRGSAGTEWLMPILRLFNPGAPKQVSPRGVARRALPITAVWSRRDGVVGGASCRLRDGDESPTARNVEIDVGHLEMGFDPRVLRLVGQLLARG